MTFTYYDRVSEFSSTTGIGDITLEGQTIGYQSFDTVYSNSDTFYYVIRDQSGPNWEVGSGTYNSGANSVTRNSVLDSSNGGSLVDFTSGALDVFTTYPAYQFSTSNGTFTGSGALVFGTQPTVASPTITGVASTQARVQGAVTKTTTGAYNITATDDIVYINKSVAASTIVNLPATPTTGRRVEIKDAKGDAATNNITVTPATGTIDGAATYVINANYGGAIFSYNGSEWDVIANKIFSSASSGASTDNAVVRWDGTGGNKLQNSGVIVDDNNGITGFRAVFATESGTSFTLSEATHGARTTLTTNGSAVAATCPNSVAAGVEGEVIQNGAGAVTFSAGVGATVQNRQSQYSTAGQYGAIRWKVVSNSGANAVYNIAGDTA